MTDIYDQIYQLIVAYAPAFTSVIAIILTAIKLLSQIKNTKVTDANLTEEINTLKQHINDEHKEVELLIQENRELRKTVQKVIDKTDIEV